MDSDDRECAVDGGRGGGARVWAEPWVLGDGAGAGGYSDGVCVGVAAGGWGEAAGVRERGRDGAAGAGGRDHVGGGQWEHGDGVRVGGASRQSDGVGVVGVEPRFAVVGVLGESVGACC